MLLSVIVLCSVIMSCSIASESISSVDVLKGTVLKFSVTLCFVGVGSHVNVGGATWATGVSSSWTTGCLNDASMICHSVSSVVIAVLSETSVREEARA